MRDFRENPNRSLDEVLDFLIGWIIEHIQGDDRRYADYFADRGVVPEVHFSVGREGSGQLRKDALALWREQKLQLEIGWVDGHHKELVFILQQFNDLYRASAERRRDENLHGEIVQYLKEWTLEHILEEDRRFKHFLDDVE